MVYLLLYISYKLIMEEQNERKYLDKVYNGQLSDERKARYEEYLNHLGNRQKKDEPGTNVNVVR